MRSVPVRKFLSEGQDCEDNMSEIKGLEEKIDGKLKMLNFMTEDTMKILEARDAKTIERYGSAVESFIDKVHQLKLQVQELRMENGDKADEVRLWKQK